MKTKGFRLMIGIVCLVFMTSLTAFSVDEAKAKSERKPIKWTMVSAWERGSGNLTTTQSFMDIFNEICGPDLVIDKMYAAGELVGSFEAIQAAASGKIDIADSCCQYLLGEIPYVGFATQGVNYIRSELEYATWLWDDGGLELLNEWVQTKLNVHVLPKLVDGPTMLFSRKPIRNLSDLEGKKIRSYGPHMKFFEELGMSAVSMPMSEVVPALEKGVIDMAHNNTVLQTHNYHHEEICPYFLTGKLLSNGYAMEAFINLDSWNALPDDLKEKVHMAAKQSMFWTMTYMKKRNALWMMNTIKNGGHFYRADPELEAEFRKVFNKLQKQFAAEDPWVKKIYESQKQTSARYEWYEYYVPGELRDIDRVKRPVPELTGIHAEYKTGEPGEY